MAIDGKKKKVAIGGLASILLVAMCVAVAVTTTKKTDNGGSSSSSDDHIISGSTKAVQAICAPTDYRETCEDSLKQANTTDPKELVRLGFDAAVKSIGDALKKSALLNEAAKDERTKGAFGVCQEVLETAVEDLQRSFDKVGEFDVTKVDDYVNDVKTWLSGAITNQETCVDAFEGTSGDTGERMKQLLRTAMELSSNGLAMVNDLSSVISSLDIGRFAANQRRRSLLSEEVIRRRLLEAAGPSKANVVVAQDGSGQVKTIKEAVAMIPPKNNQTFVIHVKAGVYKEQVEIPKKANFVVLLGDGPTNTKITGRLNFIEGTGTFKTATLIVNGEDFTAKDIGVENTAGPEGHQAVALRVSGDRAIFYNVQIDGYQDTLYVHNYRQYYRDCTISGTIDFIFGDSLALFQNCQFVVRKPMDNQACMVTAQGRKDKRSIGANIIQNGTIVAEPKFMDSKPMPAAYLGRPWKEFSRTIIMQSFIDGFISPDGWFPWDRDFALNTLYYAEYQNRGPGSNTDRRVKWKGLQKISPQTADGFTGGKVYGGDQWLKDSGVPYVPTMM